MTTLIKNDLRKENIEFTEISITDRKRLVRQGFICLVLNTYKNQIVELAENIQNSEDEMNEFFFSFESQKGFKCFAMWGK